MKDIRKLGYQDLENRGLGDLENTFLISQYPNIQIPISQLPNTLLSKAEKKISRLDAEVLLAHLLGVSRAELYIYDDDINDEIIAKFNNLVHERAIGKPLQYILGKTGFMGLEFIVTPDVFIPRPETELLVEEIIGLVKNIFNADTRKSNADKRRFICDNPRVIRVNPRSKKVDILDLGTGTGNIAIALTKFITDCKITSSDVSPLALCVAKENASKNVVDKKIEFVLSDLFENLSGFKFDIIVSNPPYVTSSQFGELSKEINFEPRIALDGGVDGLDFYRRIIEDAPRFLKERGFLILEIGFDQARQVNRLFDINNFNNIRFIEDYNNIKRIAIAQWIN